MKVPSPELLDDICVRFIFSLPDSELESFERLIFCIEQAWWHYQDNIRERDPTLMSMSLRGFCTLIFKTVPGLEPWRGSMTEIFEAFNRYKRSVPVKGAILLDPSMEQCLLVRGWRTNDTWGFPRGKLAMGETDVECAAREVKEETGLDVQGRLRVEDSIAMRIPPQEEVRMFIVPGVDTATHFAPTVRYEIGGFAWHAVSELPSTFQEDKQAFTSNEGTRHRFYNVWQFVKPLQAWIAKKRKEEVKKKGKGGDRQPAPASAPGALTQPKRGPVGRDAPGAPSIARGEPAPMDDFTFDRGAVMQALHQGLAT